MITTSHYTKTTIEHKRTIRILISILRLKLNKYFNFKSNVFVTQHNTTHQHQLLREAASKMLFHKHFQKRSSL